MWYEDDVETVVNGFAGQDESAVEDSTSTNSPTEPPKPDEPSALWKDKENTVVVAVENHHSHAIMDSPLEPSSTDTPVLNWADEINELRHPIDEKKAHKDCVISNSSVAEVVIHTTIPSPSEVLLPTWAEVAASPMKDRSHSTEDMENWGEVSGGNWEWERNWS
jgi:hypothetical protein